MPQSEQRVPVIDFTPFLNGGADRRAMVAREISQACEGTGFFYLTGHGVAQTEIDAIFAASRRFFALPLEERLKARLEIGHPGHERRSSPFAGRCL